MRGDVREREEIAAEIIIEKRKRRAQCIRFWNKLQSVVRGVTASRSET